MASIVRTYLVVAPLSVVVEDAGASVSYAPGQTFEALDTNPSVLRLLEALKIILVNSAAPPSTGFTVVTGPTGPTGPSGLGSEGLADVLAISNTSGGTGIVMTDGTNIVMGTGAGPSNVLWNGTGNIGSPTLSQRPDNVYAETSVVVGSTVTITTGAVTGSTTLGLAATGANDLSFTARASTIPFNEIGNTAFTGTVAGFSVVRAINVAATPESLATTLVAGNTTGANNIVVTTGQKVSGAAELTLEATGANIVTIRTNGADRWRVNSSGHLLPATDNLLDVGVTGTNRTRTIYAGTSTVVGDGVTFVTTAPGSVTGSAALGLAATGANDLSFTARAATIPFNEIGNTAFTGFVTGFSVVRAINTAASRNITVAAYTVDTPLTSANSGSLSTNRGAAGVVTMALPVVAGLPVGTNFLFRRLASFAFRVDPQVGDHLRYSAGAMSNGEYLEMASNEATFRVVWDGTEWLVDQENGTLTEETP